MNLEESSDEELWEEANSEDPWLRADVLMQLGHRKIQQEDWAMAKGLFGSAADLCSELDREHDLNRAVYSMGYCQYRLGEAAEAVVTLKEALKMSQDSGNARSIAHSAGPLADAYSEIGYDQEAIAAHEIAVDAFSEIEDYYSAGINCLAMGELHGKNARQTRALECFIRAFNIFQTGGDAFGAARSKDRMAAALIELDDLPQALQHITDAMHTFEHMDSFERVAYSKYRMGKVLLLMGKYVQAVEPLRQSAKFYREAGDWSSVALAEAQLAEAMLLMDPEAENEEAEKLLKRTLAYFESAGELSHALVVQTIQGDRLFAKGRLDASIAMFKDVVARAVEHEDWDLVRGARTSLAEILFKAGHHFEARDVLDLVDAAEWGENNLELKRLEEVKTLMLDTMSMMLNIEVKR